MNCRVETLYLSEIVGAEARAISVSGTRVSIMTKATLDAMAGRAEASAGRSWAPSPTQRAGTARLIRGTFHLIKPSGFVSEVSDFVGWEPAERAAVTCDRAQESDGRERIQTSWDARPGLATMASWLSFGVPRPRREPSAQSAAPTLLESEAEALFEQRQHVLERTLSASGLLPDDSEEPPQRSRRRPSSRSREARGLHALASSSTDSPPSAAAASSTPAPPPSVASTPSRQPFRTAKALLEAEPLSPPAPASQEPASPPEEIIEEPDELNRFWRIMSRRRLSFVEAAAQRADDVVARREVALAAAGGDELVEAHAARSLASAEARARARAEARRAEVEREMDEYEEDERESPWSLLCARAPRDAVIASRACGRGMVDLLFEETSSSIAKDFGDRFEEYARMLDEVDFGEPLPASASPWRAAYLNGTPS